MPDDTPGDYCTISMDNAHICGDPCLSDAPIPICTAHAAALLAFMADAFDQAVTSDHGLRTVAVVSSGIDRRARLAKPTPDSGVVYYVKVGDLIKIGTTTQLKRRMAAYPPYSTLLATENGGLTLEAQRHAQFADCLATGSEWFAPTTRLLEHIASLRETAA